MLKNDRKNIEDLFKNDFEAVLRSEYAPYKRPSNLDENLINVIGASMKSKRRGQTSNWKCPLETEYQRLKEKGFPVSDVKVKVAKALAQLKCEENKQASIKNFFSVVPSSVPVVEEHRLVHSEMDEIEEDDDPEVVKEGENKEPDYTPPGKLYPVMQ